MGNNVEFSFIDQSKYKIDFVTPDGVKFTQPLASLVDRLWARLLDFLITSMISSVVNIPIFVMFGTSGNYDIMTALNIILYFLISFGYDIYFECYQKGQTIGKKALQIQVVDKRGYYVSFHQSMIRNILRIVDMLPLGYFTGLTSMFFTKSNQRLGDIAGDVVVVKLTKGTLPNLDNVLPVKYNSFESEVQNAAKIRQRIDGEVAQIALTVLMMRDELSPPVRVELFKDLATYFKSLVTFSEEITSSLSDENYVRNVLYLLFKK